MVKRDQRSLAQLVEQAVAARRDAEAPRESQSIRIAATAAENRQPILAALLETAMRRAVG